MAGFNAITSPLTLANTQAQWASWTNGVSNGTNKPAATKQAAPAPAKAPAAQAAPAPAAAPVYRAPAVYVDPYAKWGGKANYYRAVGDYNSAKTNAYSSINDAIGDTGNKLNSSVLDYLGNLRTSQKAIDKAAVQNEMSRESGRLGVMDMVGRGIQSGGVILNNKAAQSTLVFLG